MKAKGFGFGMGLITVGGTLLAIVPLKKEIQDHLFEIPENVYNILLATGIAFCTLGVLAVIVAVVHQMTGNTRLLEQVKAYIDWIVSNPHFERSSATENDFDRLFDFSREEFGEEVDQEVREKMLQWHHKNPEYLWILHRVRTRDGAEVRRHLVGYFSIFPLNKAAARRVDRGELYGASISEEDMVSLEARPAGIYIGGIAARGKVAQQFAMGVLMERLDKLLSKGVPLYTRPVSDDGKRLVRKYGFAPVRKIRGDESWKIVWKLSRPSVAKLVEPKIQRKQARKAARQPETPVSSQVHLPPREPEKRTA
ncbi:MAG TPA: hypothetical protein VN493_24175 [Thermoanaerobaculia bacterium]|nr:hypothetical protein [Thermoanaerobaculia bacterium]